MSTREAILAFIVALDDAKDNATAPTRAHISDMPEPLQALFKRAVKAVVDSRYDHAALRAAADLVPPPEAYSGGLGEMIHALTRVLIDNDAFDLR